VHAITEAALLGHLNVLAADGLRGRRAGSDYERQAAEYIRGEFMEYGLELGALDYFQSFPITRAVDGQTGLISQNVLGVLPGQGALATQWVIVGGHYDHLGWQNDGGSVVVYNGADDNASGTAAVMEVARYLSQYMASDSTAGRDHRSIMFQAYGAEEVGLIGSSYFCNQPTVPMDSIVAMVNLDMIGRLRDNQLILIGTSSSAGWGDLVGSANLDAFSLTPSDEVLDRSDQYCFYERSRPILFLHTGTHPQYHTLGDDVELLDIEGMVRIGELAARVVLDLAFRPDRLAFSAGPVRGIPGRGIPE
jgi:Zn-dependent M28 family amino/carboxypeptidase